jgi:RNA polymerase sigma-70 factor (ECF subfamily)
MDESRYNPREGPIVKVNESDERRRMGAAAQVPEPAEGALEFGEAYERHARSLYGTALRMLGRREDAEDAMQEVFLIFHRHRRELDPAQLGGWLRRVMVNHCIDRIRRRRRRPEETWSDEVQVKTHGGRASRIDLRDAVARLPERARMVFLLHDVEGLRHQEVAELMGITEGGSKSQLWRARGLLRERLEGGS